MRKQISWTDEELRKAWCALAGGWMASATEFSEARRFLASLGAVHPAEAREREREAWDVALCLAARVPERRINGEPWDDADRDRRYPSLLPKSPPPLLLSTGTWTQSVERSDLGESYVRWASPDNVLRHFTPLCRTASDAEKLAAWLREWGSDDERK